MFVVPVSNTFKKYGGEAPAHNTTDTLGLKDSASPLVKPDGTSKAIPICSLLYHVPVYKDVCLSLLIVLKYVISPYLISFLIRMAAKTCGSLK